MSDQVKVTLALFMLRAARHGYGFESMESMARFRGKSRQSLSEEVKWLLDHDYIRRYRTTRTAETHINWDHPTNRKVLDRQNEWAGHEDNQDAQPHTERPEEEEIRSAEVQQ